jgi:hypothetical protein
MRLGIGRGKGDEVMPHDLLCEEKGGVAERGLGDLCFCAMFTQTCDAFQIASHHLISSLMRKFVRRRRPENRGVSHKLTA